MNRTYRIVLIPMMGTAQVMSEVARPPGAVLNGAADSSKSRLTQHLLAMAIGVALASAACPLPAQICTPSATTICGANGGNASGRTGGSGTVSGSYGNGGGNGGIPGGNGSGSGGSGGGGGGGSGGPGGGSGGSSASGGGGGGYYGPTIKRVGGGGGVGISGAGGVGSGSGNGSAGGGGGGSGGGVSSQGAGGGGGGGAVTTNSGGGGGGGGGAPGYTALAGASLVNRGAIAGGYGGIGGNDSSSGIDAGAGGGGGGGAGIYAMSGSTLTSGVGTTITGGNGGIGGVGYASFAAGGGGGGGAGVVGTGFTLHTDGAIQGGDGGSGGAGVNGSAGGGGAGGVGVAGSQFQLINRGTITGGNWGVGGSGGAGADGGNGAGGIGVVSTGGSTISNSGTIAGGLNGDGTQAEAIALSGGGNQLVMEAGATFIGTVISRSGTTNGGDTFTLGGSSNASFDLAMLGAAIQGFERLAKAGTSTWTLTGTGNAAQAWTIADGTLTVDTTSLIGNVTFAPASGGNPDLTFNQATNGVYNGTISGAGTLTKTGAAVLTLAGNNTYSGNTTVAAGTLSVAGSIAGDAQVNSGATLGGTGTIGGAVTLTSGAHLAPGASAGTLTVGQLLLDSGSQLDYELGLPNLVGGGGSDLTNVTGNLTLDGTLNVTDVGGLDAGVYRLIDYGGVLTNNGLAIGALPPGFTPAELFVQTSRANQVNLIVFANLFWDGAQTTGNGVVEGGTGTWNTTATHWTAADGVTNVLWQTGLATFAGTAGTVTLAQDIEFSGMQFLTDGYRIAGAGPTLGGTPTTVIRADAGVTGTVGVPIVDGTNGPVALVKSEAGTLVLTGSNTYSGGTAIEAGKLQLGDGGTTGSLMGDVTDNGVLEFNRSDAITFGGVISGTGALTQAGIGTVTLAAANTYSGGTNLNAGTLSAGADANLGATVGGVTFNGGALQFTSGFTTARTLTLNAPATIDTQANANTLSGAIGGSGALTKQGSGTLTLAAANTYSGNTTVAAGRLSVTGGITGNAQVNSGATLGGTGTVGGTATFASGGHLAPGASTGTLTVGHLLLDSGSQLDYELGLPNLIGGGTNDLTTVTGNVTLAGTLNVTDVGGFSSGVYRLINYGGVLTDSGLAIGSQPAGFAPGEFLIQTSQANQINLIVQAGGFTNQFWDGAQVTGNGVIDGGTGTWNATTTNWTGADGSTNAPWQSGFAIFGGGAGTVTLGQSIDFSGMQFLTDGYLIAGGGFSLAGTPSTAIRVDPAATATIGAPIIDGTGGATTLAKTDEGTLVLTGANTYTGGTILQAGTLQLGNGGTAGSLMGDVTNNGVLAFNRSDTVTFDGTVSGAGALMQGGTGTLTLTGNHTYTGGTTISAGTLQLGSGGTTGSIAGNVTDNGTLTFNRSDAVTYAGLVTGTGALIQLGGGTLTLTGNHSYTGGTAIGAAGTLQLGDGGTTGSIVGNVTDNGTLVFNRSDVVTYAGVVAGTGSLIQAGSGTTILTGNNTYLGGSTISAGTVRLGNGGTAGFVAGNILDDGALVFARSDAVTFNGLISGAGTVEQAGTGVLQLTANNPYTGGTTLTQGVLAISDPSNIGALSSTLVFNGGTLRYESGFGAVTGHPVTVLAAGGTVDTNGFDVTYSGTASGPGTLTKVGNGMLTLAGANTVAGGIIIDAGGVTIGEGGTTGSVAGPIVDNTALVFDRSDDITYSGTVSGSGTLTQAGGGTLFLNGANTYSGGTTINSGMLQVDGDANLGSTSGGVTFNGGTLESNGVFSSTRNAVLNSGGAVLISRAGMQWTSPISGVGSLTVQAGTVTVTADNAYIGGTGIGPTASLVLGNGGTSGSVQGDIANAGGLAFNRSNPLTYDGTISGAGSLTQQGVGTTILTGDNTYTGGTTIVAGTLQLGDGSITGSVAGSITNSGALIFNRSSSLTHAGSIGGSGSVTQAGAGWLTLSGNSTYTGLTTVASGRLSVDGSLVGDVDVHAGTTLSGIGTVGGSVTLADNGRMAPGNSAGTLHVGSLLLSANSQIDYELGLPDVVGGGTNDLIEVAGDLTLAGHLNITDIGGFGDGVYRLFDYGGTLTDQGMVFGTLPNGIVPGDLLMQAAVAGQVNLIVQAGGFGLQFWDGANTTGNGVIEGGSGAWNATSTNWSGANGAVNAPWQSGFAVFEGTPGTVTLADNLAFTGMQFVADGYTIAGNGSSLAAGPGMVIRVDPGATATINATIVDGAGGAAQLTKTDAGTLVLGGANVYTGGTALQGGTLQASEDANLGAASGGLSLDDGTLATTASFASARTITLDTTGGTFAPVAGTTLSLSGPIGGAGSLTKVDAGTLVLGGGNSYGGGTFLQGGALAVLADANLGAASGAMDFNGGTLRLEGGFDPAATRDVTLGALGGSIDTQGFTSTFAQSIHGAGALTKLGAGTLILVADNTFSGSTTIAAGTVQLGNGGTSGSVVGNILDNGALVFNRSDTASYAGIVSGSGMLSVMGGGTLVLGGDSTYTGGTTIAAGALQLGDGGTSGSVAGNVLNDGAVLFDRSDDVSFAGVIRGVGTMTKLGTNTLTLTGNNSYTGTTTITGGVLQVGDGGSTGALVGNTVNDGGLTFNRSGSLSYAGAISGSGWVRQRGPGTTVLSGASSYTGGTFISAGTLSVSADQHLGDPSSAVSLNGGTLQLAASFSSARNLLIDTAGGTIDVTDRNELTGHIDGTGALIKSGSGALIVNTVANATGPIEVATGTLVVGDSAHPSAQLAGNGDVNVAAGAFLGGYGQVVGRVNNAGTLGVGNALPALANDLDAQFTIVGPLVNMGSITMVNGAAVDQLIVSGNYVSSGGQLETEAVLNEGGQAAQSDRLVANTVSLAGSPTGIVVHNLGGTGAVTSGDGIALVNVLDASLSAAGAFVLAGRAVAGPYEYVLFQGGVADPGDGQWYLRSQAQPEPPTTPTPLPPLPVPVPIFRPEVGAYLANRQSAADAMRQTLHDRQGDPQYSREGATDADSTLGKVWLRVQGGNVRSQAADGLLATQGRQSLIQLGGDFGSWTVFSETDRLHVGGMAGYADGRADIIAQFNPAQAKGHAYGYFAGAYATWFANNDQRLGAYVDTWLQAGWFNNHVRSSMLPDVHYDSTHWAASIESGYGFAAGKNWVVEPQVQVIYNDYQADSLTDSTGTRVGSLNGSATIGRLGVRVYPQLMSSYYGRPFIEANWWNGGSTHAITFNGIPVSDAVPSNRYQLNVGLQMRTGEGWVIWGRLGGEWGSAQYERVNGQLGLKYSW